MIKAMLSVILMSSLSSSVYAQQELRNAGPSTEEVIRQQTEIGLQRALEQNGLWSTSPANQCKYAIRVPDPVTAGKIALTFDDGPDPEVTPLILDVLKRHNIKATFFVWAGKVDGNELIIQRTLAEGHIIGSHSFSHPNFHKLTVDEAKDQINSADQVLRYFTDPSYFRFPYGNSTCESVDYVKSLGYSIVGWNIDTCDWAYADGYVDDKENATCLAPGDLRRDYPAYVNRVVAQTKGGVLLMHDVHLNTAETLDRLLTLLKEKNYQFVTLDDLQLYPKLNGKK